MLGFTPLNPTYAKSFVSQSGVEYHRKGSIGQQALEGLGVAIGIGAMVKPGYNNALHIWQQANYCPMVETIRAYCLRQRYANAHASRSA